jgi:hypothetical protein
MDGRWLVETDYWVDTAGTIEASRPGAFVGQRLQTRDGGCGTLLIYACTLCSSNL